MARHVVFDGGEPHRGIERHRDPAGEQRAVEAEDVLPGGRQHDRHRLSRREPGLAEAQRVARGALPDRAVAERRLGLVLVEENGEALGLALDVPGERLDQRLRLGGRAHALALRQAHHRAVGDARRLAGAGEEETQQVARRLGRGERLLGEARAELALEAQHQLDARQAVQPEVALERAVEGDLGGKMRVRLACDIRHDGEQPVRIDGRSHAGAECTLARTPRFRKQG